MRRVVSGIIVGVLLFGLLPGRADAVTQEKINKAVERGVAALKRMQNGGVWPHNEIGCTALAALTLLECDVAPDDKVILEAAAHVRDHVPKLTSTYSLSLVLMFLDRLGDPADIPLMESLAVRLLAGQQKDGGWAYQCPLAGGDEEANRLANLIRNRTAATSRRTRDPKEKPRTASDLSPPIKELLIKLSSPGSGGPAGAASNSDNSNTQFATLALWVARRHGLPVHNALLTVAARHRASQKEDGGWTYQNETGVHESLPTMTCACVLGLAVGRGAWADIAEQKKKDPKEAVKVAKDEALQRGLKRIANCIDHPASIRRAGVPSLDGSKGYYFLWSLERVSMALGAETYDKKDWFTWGAEIILANQKEDGSWMGEYGACGADTCFALLFLRRSNLASDLTHTLRGDIKDMVVLRGVALKDGDKLFEGVSIKRALEGSAIAKVADPKSTALTASILALPAGARDSRLEELREGKGTMYTEALAAVIPRLNAAERKKARDYLSARLARMKASTLGEYLHDDDAEIRRAAAWALACKDDKMHVPDLIALLTDNDTGVALTANEALRELTAHSIAFDTKDPGRTAKEWKEWWAKQVK